MARKPPLPTVTSGPPHTFGYLLIQTLEDGSAIWEAPNGDRHLWPDNMTLFRTPGLPPIEEPR